MTEADNMTTAIRLVLNMLQAESLPTAGTIRKYADSVYSMLQTLGQSDGIDKERLIRHVESKCSIFVPTSATLEDQRDHLEWLSERRSQIEWNFWNRYRRYLEDVEQLAPQAVQRLNEVTNDIVSRLEDPLRKGAWDRRGMVVGQVQSGKTSNYTGLICKAADAGYRLIVVLAGSHNSLRSQTQRRLDRDFLGFDTQQRMHFDQTNTRIGVGRLPGTVLHIVHSLTNAAENGDFSLKVAGQATLMLGGAEPVLLVVKKNATVLKNLLRWATYIRQELDPGSGRKIVQGVPLLLIDDEADNASINTNIDVDEHGKYDEDLDPTKINGLIRKLLHSFEMKAYVGYTATPFANIFIADEAVSEVYGSDLFPRSFIINLSPPSNYLGPAKVFGLAADQQAGTKATAGLPIIRQVDDYADWMPDKHTKEHVPGSLPGSLRTALRSFILTCAARAARSSARAHNSMLIHVTRFISVQAHVARQVDEELNFLQGRLKYGDGAAPEPLLGELETLWETDYAPTMRSMQTIESLEVQEITWTDVKPLLYAAASKIEIRRINGSVKDTLQYDEHPNGQSVICIGGDKLSRGLTLEGLSVSYYLRASRMYDTLMQMGRWFGYRPGYADLCRLYTTDVLVQWYRDIATADDELRQKFEDMAALDQTPEQYGLGIRNHPDGLMITAAAKMRRGQRVFVSFSESIIETISFYEDKKTTLANLEATEHLIRRLAPSNDARPPDQERHTRIWKQQPGDLVVEFLETYRTHSGARKARTDILKKYIDARMARGELVEWTIALVSSSTAKHCGTIAGLDVGLIERERIQSDSMLTKSRPSNGDYVIRRLVSPTDERIDLTQSEFTSALEKTRVTWQKNPGRSQRKEPPNLPSGLAVRETRPSSRGLLLLYPLDPSYADPPVNDGEIPVIGFAISFPKSSDAEHSAVEYTVNKIYWEEVFGEANDD